MNLRKVFALATIWIALTSVANAQFGVNNVSVSPADPTPCDSITFTITGDHDQANITISSLAYTFTADTLFFVVNAVIPPMSVGGLTPFSYTRKIAPLMVDTFIIKATYSASIPTFPPNQVIDTLIVDTNLIVNAGPDVSYCDTNACKLQGNNPGSLLGTWTVLTGGATLSSSTVHDPIASNLSYGINTFVWSIPSSACGTGKTDTVHIFNSRAAVAQTMPDVISCYDTIVLMANTPIAGMGLWEVKTGGATLSNSNDSVTLASGLSAGQNKFKWNVSDTNGVCPSASDLLFVDYNTVTAVNITRIGDTLLAGTAPSYQWYMDGNILTGETNQKLVITSNGTYKVKVDAIGCTNGPFSNEILADDFVGISEIDPVSVRIYPNPASDYLKISVTEFVGKNATLTILDLSGRTVLEVEGRLKNGLMTLDLSGINDGLYLLSITSEGTQLRKTFIKK